MLQHVCEGQRSVFQNELSPFTMWVLGTELRLTAMEPESLSIESSHCLRKETFMITNPKHLTSEDMFHHSHQQQK